MMTIELRAVDGEVRGQLGGPVEVVGTGQPGADLAVEGRGHHAGGEEVGHERVAQVDAERVPDDEHPQLGVRARPHRGGGRRERDRSWAWSSWAGWAAWGSPPSRCPAGCPCARADCPVPIDHVAEPESRLTAAIGPSRSSDTVRRIPTGDTCALCCRVGASSTSQRQKASERDPASTRRQSTGRPAGCARDHGRSEPSGPGSPPARRRGRSARAAARPVSSSVAIRTGSR